MLTGLTSQFHPITARVTRLRSMGAIAAALLCAQGASASDYIVKVKGGSASFHELASRKSFFGMQIADKHEAGSLLLLNFKKATPTETAQKLAEILSDPAVQYVVENKKVHAFGMPNDPDFSKQWSMAKVRASDAWASGTGSKNIVVAITDTGVDYKHPDLAANMWRNTKEIPGNGIDDDGNGFADDVFGYDFNKNDSDPMDETSSRNPGHGTHCAGIMGAVGNNSQGISGMSQNLSMMAVRFLGSDGSGDLMGAAKTIDYAVANGAHIISASWGAAISATDAQPVTDAISRANDKGVIFVVAAANDGKNNDSTSVFPANTDLPNVISVAASDSNDAKPTWSNYGLKTTHVAAPGADIWSTLPSSKFGNLSGTSMATPLVSGLVGLMLSHDPKLTGPEVKALLQSSGSKVAIETACQCRVDAAAAVDRVRARSLTVVPQAATLNPTQTIQLAGFGGTGQGYTFTSSSDAVASVDANGVLTAQTLGEVNVTVADSSGATNQSLLIRIVEAGSGGGGGGGSAECPLDPAMCELMCGIMPDLPWCK